MIEINEKIFIDGKEIKIISGAVHYFRLEPSQWHNTLMLLSQMGCNCVETYIPWNFHEKEEGIFDFKTFNHDIESFINAAKRCGLYVILRPSPYICAEWEFGGLPYWLLNKDCKIRTSDPKFLKYVKIYYDNLLPIINKFQITNGGPVILIQIENEYGSYGNDKEYLQKNYEILREGGVDVPLFTSDGDWYEALNAGYIEKKDVLPCVNFGSRTKERILSFNEFMEEKHRVVPIFCMEFWDGWFNKWGQDIITRDPKEMIKDVEDMLELGSINFYMFQGGTNYGFMNGCSARGTTDYHQVTSYDYDAPITEHGTLNEKYMLLKSLLTKNDDIPTHQNELQEYENCKLRDSVSLFNTLESISKPIYNKWPLNMEKLGQGYGYIIYQTKLGKKRNIDKVRVIEASDRVKVYLNNKEVITQYKEEIGNEFSLTLNNDENDMKILVENMGRVNYGSKLLAPTQRKGIRNGVMVDIHFESDWEHYNLELNNIDDVDFTKEFTNGPAFHRYILNTDKFANSYIDCRGFGKGCIFVNGFNIGRFWEIGPTMSLYLPKDILKEQNEIVVFETEGKFKDHITFSKIPITF